MCLSLVIHVTVFACTLVPLIKFAKALQQEMLDAAAKKEAATKEPALTFIEVNVEQPAVEAPKDAKFYGAANVLPAKAEEKPEAPKPLQPSISPPAPPPVAEIKPAETKVSDLALAKPQGPGPKPIEVERKEEVVVTPLALKPTVPKPVEKVEGDKNIKRQDLTSSPGVKNTVVGGYDQRFIEIVQRRWDELIKQVSSTRSGKVVVDFRLHHDGRVSEIAVRETNVDEMQTLLCKKAISDPAPYPKWTSEIRKELRGDTRDVAFTFFYREE